MTFAPTGLSGGDRQPNASLLSKLEGIRQQVLQHLLQAFRVGDHAAGEVSVSVNFEREPLVLRLVTERPRDRIEQAGEEDFFRLDGDSSRFDFREIENVADEVEEIGAGSVDGAGKFDLLQSQIAIRIVSELLAQHKNAVQRGAQLV